LKPGKAGRQLAQDSLKFCRLSDFRHQMLKTQEPNAQELRQRIEAGSQQVDDYLDLASLLLHSGDADQSLSIYQRALDLPLTNIERADVLYSLSELLLDTCRDPEQARVTADRCISTLSPQPDTDKVLLLRGSAHGLIAYCTWGSDSDARAEAMRALGYLERVISSASDNEVTKSALLEAGRACSLIGETEKTIADYSDYLTRDLSDSARGMALWELITRYRMNERLAEAEKTANTAIEYGCSDVKLLGRVYLELGMTHHRQNRLSEAMRAFKEAVRLLQDGKMTMVDREMLIDSRVWLANVLFDAGDTAGSAEQCRLVLDSLGSVNETRRVAILLALGHLKFAMQEYSAAAGFYSDVLSSTKAKEEDKRVANQELLFVDGIRLYDSHNLEEARAAFLRLLAQPIDKATRQNALDWLATCYWELGHFAAAHDTYREILASEPAEAERERAHESMTVAEGHMLYDARKYGEAQSRFQWILDNHIAEDSYRVDAFLWLGHCFFQLRNFSQAKRCYIHVRESSSATEEQKDTAERWRKAIPSVWARLLHRLIS
jgi:tetratricopeptide (TPR) repeat protein